MNNTAEAYDHVQRRYQGKNGVELIDKLALRKGNVVLDLGCGTGYLSSVLAERVGPLGRVVGVDPNKKRLHVANEKYGHVENLHFVFGSSTNFPSGPYDVIFANQVMQWIEDKESAFKYVYQNLKVGGTFAFLCPADPANRILELLNPTISESLFYCSCEEYESLALVCDFEVEHKSIETVTHKFENVDKYITWALATMDVDPLQIDPEIIYDVKKRIEVPELKWKKLE